MNSESGDCDKPCRLKTSRENFIEMDVPVSIAHSILISQNKVNQQKPRQDVVNSLLPGPLHLIKRPRDEKPQGAGALR